VTPGPGVAAARALALGAAWYVLELALVLADRTGAPLRDVLRSWLALLPWQLALFGALAVVVAGLARAGVPHVGWWILGGATFVFLGGRVAEGALRTASIADAAIALLVVAVVLGAALAALAWIGGRLPVALRGAWPLAVLVGWSLFWIPFLRRAGASIALGELALREWPGFVSAASLAAGLAGAGVVLVARARRGGARALVPALLCAALAPASAARAAAPDVIIVLLDTLRADHVGPHEGAPSLTPNLDAIAAEGVTFARAYSPANVTRRAMPGLLAASTERVVGAPLAPDVRTLAQSLHETGLATVGVSANPFVSRHYGYDRGFERFSDPAEAPTFLVAPLVQLLLNVDDGAAYRLGLAGSSLYYEPADELFARGLRMLDTAAQPALLYLHAMDVHGPYLPPRRLLPPDYDASDYVPYSRMLRLDRAAVVGPAFAPALRNVRERYAAGARFADEQLGHLRDELVRRGRWDEALVCIVADHGEALGEQGFVGHGIASLMPAVTQVPFVWKLPRSWAVAPRVVATPVSTIDLAPTVLELLGGPALPDAFGTSLAAVLRSGAEPATEDVVSWNPFGELDYYAAVGGPWQLAVAIDARGARTRALFDLDADPDAQNDVAPLHPDRVAALEAAIDRYLAHERRLVRGAGTGAVDAATRARLRALGYVDDAP
jgi:arylsulfatase